MAEISTTLLGDGVQKFDPTDQNILNEYDIELLPSEDTLFTMDEEGLRKIIEVKTDCMRQLVNTSKNN